MLVTASWFAGRVGMDFMEGAREPEVLGRRGVVRRRRGEKGCGEVGGRGGRGMAKSFSWVRPRTSRCLGVRGRGVGGEDSVLVERTGMLSSLTSVPSQEVRRVPGGQYVIPIALWRFVMSRFSEMLAIVISPSALALE